MKKSNTQKQKNRELIVSISLFLLGREELKDYFWNIRSVEYSLKNQKVAVGITTIDGKLGTTLEKLRKTCKPLSNYLYETGITFRKPHIHFYVYKEEKADENEDQVKRIKAIIDSISQDTVENNKK